MSELDRRTLGERVRVARVNAGMTQDSVAAALAVARTTVVAMERGDRKIRPNELLALAELFKMSVGSLVRPSAIHVDIHSHFRDSGGADSAKAETISLLAKLATSYIEMEVALGIEASVRPPPDYPVMRGAVLPQAEDASLALRNYLGLGLAPIPDVLRLAELQLGMRIFFQRLDSKVAGAFFFHERLGACVLVNRAHPPSKTTWTIAHEIGHFIGERFAPEVLLEDNKEEKFADAFAGCFLMPPAALRRRFAENAAANRKFTPRDLILLAHEYGVSLEAGCRWLERLGLLLRGTYDALRKRGLNGDVVQSVVHVDVRSRQAVPTRMLLVAAECMQRGIVTEGQVVDMLAVDRLTLREMLDGIPDGAFDHIN